MISIPFTKRPRFWALPALPLPLPFASMALQGGALASADASRSPRGTRPTVVLVHGAWTDGSSWSQVSNRLQKAGYDVRVPPNNLRGVGSDAADVASYLSTISGPIVLVGHSYGGMVITNAARGNSHVLGLVYVDAYIPAEGDTLVGLTHPPSVFAHDPANVLDFVPYFGGPPSAVDTYVKDSVYRDAFANEGFSRQEIRVMAASQRPLSSSVFTEASARRHGPRSPHGRLSATTIAVSPWATRSRWLRTLELGSSKSTLPTSPC